jgi:uncharacterized protein YbcI
VTGIPQNGHARVQGDAQSEISASLVEFHRRYYGQGPAEAKTEMLDDMVVCTLVGGFTAIEHTLLEAGDRGSVYGTRLGFQQTMENDFRRIVEEATGRKVIACMSAVHLDTELAVELFVLESLSKREVSANGNRADRG